MMSPNKIARHDDGPGGVNLLGQILKLEHLDIEPEVCLEEHDVDTVLQHVLNLEEPDESISDLSACIKESSYPCTPQEPQLSEQELQRLDGIADQVEIERLFGLQVLLTDTLPPEAKSLSTRFVRSWWKTWWVWHSDMASPKSIGSQRILLVTAGPWGVVFTGLIEHCYKGAAGVLPCLAGSIWKRWCLPWTWRTRF